MRTAAALIVARDELAALRQFAGARQAPAALVQRAKILLLAAEGVSNTEIGERLGISRPTVIAWRRRFAREGLAGLTDRPRPGRPQTQRTHDYVRDGTTTLFAALEVATGKVTDRCYPRHRHREFLAFLQQVAKAYRVANCMSWWTTTPPTSTQRSVPGWPSTPGSGCTSPDLGVMAQPGRGVLRHHHAPGVAPG